MINSIVFSMLPGSCLAGAFMAFGQSNLSGKLIVFVLCVGSIFAWSIMVTKYMEFTNALRGCESFKLLYKKQQFPTRLYAESRRMPPSPLTAVYQSTCARLCAILSGRGADVDKMNTTGVIPDGMARLRENEMRTVRDSADQAVAEQALLLENNMGFLATAVTAAPFLGLLGTVWGVMDAFGGIAVTGSATLSAVAPGISAALLTTVVGLLVALPSVIGYNILTHKIRKLTVMMESFSQELFADIECRLADM